MLVNIGPILIAVFAGCLLGEGFPRWLVVGIAVAFAGVVLIGLATRGAGTDLLGVVLCVIAAVTYAGGVVAQKPLLRRLPGLQVTFLACAIGAVCCLPWVGALVTEVAVAPVSSIARRGLPRRGADRDRIQHLGLRPDAGWTPAASASPPTWCRRWSSCSAGCCSTRSRPRSPLVGGAICLLGVALSRRRSRVKEPVPLAQEAGATA